MQRRRYREGESIFPSGDPAEAVYRVASGSVRLVGAYDGGQDTERVLRAGEVFGEAGLLSGRARTMSADAAEDAEIEEIARAELIGMLEKSGDEVRALLAGLFEQAARQVAAEAGPAAGVSTLRLLPASRRTASHMPAEGIAIERLPFAIGRATGGEGNGPGDGAEDGGIDLILPDKRPYNLSRHHFAIEAADGRTVVRDCDSYHGTVVNGETIGGAAPARSASQIAGENEIVAGPLGSPFRFTLLYEPD